MGRKCEFKPFSFFLSYDMRAAGSEGGCIGCGAREGEGVAGITR